MSERPEPRRWRGLRESARTALEQRDYTDPPAGAGELVGREPIPGVLLFPRRVHAQRHRGHFGELARRDEPPLAEIGLWPAQWASACMFGGTAKGFHIHPPHVPEGEEPEAWFQRLFGEGADCALRPYDREQWDVMFFVRGLTEVLLVDERAGLPREVMHFYIDGDDHAGPDNVGLVIPAGVAHALRAASGEDVVMVYGTSTVFDPGAEGRIGAGLERAALPDEWQAYVDGGTGSSTSK